MPYSIAQRPLTPEEIEIIREALHQAITNRLLFVPDPRDPKTSLAHHAKKNLQKMLRQRDKPKKG